MSISATTGGATGGATDGSWRDPRLPSAQRAALLLGQLTLTEKAAMLHQYAPAVERLGLAAFRTGTEALHGAAWLGEATVFPQAAGLGATWDPHLVEQVGTATAVEVRALHAASPDVSLNVWAPVVNLLRDPRWGRNEEGYSEDPLLVSTLAIAYCRGLRGGHPGYVRTAPSLKHFLAYNHETLRSSTSSGVPPRVLHEYDLAVFRDPVLAGVVDAVMPAYNLVNGHPCHVSPLLRLLRTWGEAAGRDLVLVSDAEAPANLVTDQRAYPDHPSGYAAALRAGLDSFTVMGGVEQTAGRVTEALHRGLITEADVDRALGRLLALRIRTGEFDPDHDPYAGIGPDALHDPAHRDLARRTARAQIVLLRNRSGLLPLRPAPGRRLAVVGPFADTLCQDWYSGTMPYRITVAAGLGEAIAAAGGEVVTAEGADRIRLRAARSGGYLSVTGDDGSVTLAPDGASDAAAFDLFDWGQEVLTLRSVRTRRYLSARDDTGTLLADQVQPNGWEVSETFTIEPHPAGEAIVIRHVRTGTYLTGSSLTGSSLTGSSLAGSSLTDGPRAAAATAAEAEPFVLETLRHGADDVRAVIAGADDVVLVLGNDPHINGRETQDRVTLSLPPAQERLLRTTASHPRAVLLVMSSYPYALGAAAAGVPAIAWTSHAGQETGHAVADVLLGAHEPGGRLAQTWYHDDRDVPDLLDYDIIGSRRTYQYLESGAEYPFGHGLTYTTFTYGPPAAVLDPAGPTAEATVRARVLLTNTGERAGTEVVQVYTCPDGPAAERPRRPRRKLQAFTRVHLAAGESREVTLTFPLSGLAHWDPASEAMLVAPGRYQVLIGGSSAVTGPAALITIDGSPRPPRPLDHVPAVLADEFSGLEFTAITPESGSAVSVPFAAPGDDGTPSGRLVLHDALLPAGGCRFTAQVTAPQGGTGARILLRTGDPDSGPLLAEVAVPGVHPVLEDLAGLAARPGGAGPLTWPQPWTQVTATVTAPGGVADLWLVLEGPGTRLEWFALTAVPSGAAPGPQAGPPAGPPAGPQA